MAISASEIKPLVPRKTQKDVTPALVGRLNTVDSDKTIKETIHNVFRGYIGLLSEFDFRLNDFVDACIFTGYKFHGFTNVDAFIRTFPRKYQKYMAHGADMRHIAVVASGYARRGVVSKVIEQAMSKMWVLNLDVYQEAINTQAELMRNAKSEKVRCDAANSILTHLAKPKDTITNNHVNIDLRQHVGLEELKESLKDLADNQLKLIGSGVATKDVVEIGISPKKDSDD